MTASEIKCKKCGSDNVFIQSVGNNTGLYCSECGKWIKWINKDEQRIVERHIENYTKQPIVLGSITLEVDRDVSDDDDELLFTGMNITEVVLDTLLKTKKKATQGMNKNELKAYELGISNTLAFLQVILTEDDNCVVNTFGKAREYTYEELKEYFNSLKFKR